MSSQSDRFFSLPLKVKQKLEMAPTPDPQRGYLSYGVEKTSQLTDLHEDVEHLAQEKTDEEFMDERVCASPNHFPVQQIDQ